MITRSKAGIFKPKHHADLAYLGMSGLHQVLLTTTIPKGFKSTSKHAHLLMDMDEEMRALQWELVPRPSHANVVGSKWIFAQNLNLMAPLIVTRHA